MAKKKTTKKEQKEEKVMGFVEKELKKNPDIATTDLYEKAKKVDPLVEKLTLRQFNARFPLQVKRRQKPKARRRGGRRRTGTRARAAAAGNRDAVREVFLRFAGDLAAAEERKDLVQILSKVDAYVDDALKAAKK